MLQQFFTWGCAKCRGSGGQLGWGPREWLTPLEPFERLVVPKNPAEQTVWLSSRAQQSRLWPPLGLVKTQEIGTGLGLGLLGQPLLPMAMGMPNAGAWLTPPHVEGKGGRAEPWEDGFPLAAAQVKAGLPFEGGSGLAGWEVGPNKGSDLKEGRKVAG